MSVNTVLYLPVGTYVRDVAEVAAILMGHVPEMKRYKDSSANFEYCKVEGYKIRAFKNQAAIGELTISATEGMEYSRNLVYSYEVDDRPGQVSLSLASNAEGIALLVKLAEFFGGEVQYKDSTDSVDETHKRPRKSNHPDGQAYQKFEREKFNVQSMSYTFVKSYESVAAYKS